VTSWDAVATDPKSLSARANLAQVILKQGNQARPRKCSVRRRRILPTIRRECACWQTTTLAPDRWTRPRRSSQALAAKYPKNTSVQKGYIRVLLQVKDYATAQTVVAGLMKKNAKDPEVAD
jgi:hypothetical protein